MFAFGLRFCACDLVNVDLGFPGFLRFGLFLRNELLAKLRNRTKQSGNVLKEGSWPSNLLFRRNEKTRSEPLCRVPPRERLLPYPDLLQGTLFDRLEAETGPLGKKARLLVGVLERIPRSRQLPCARGWLGRPTKDRQALACAFIAKSVYAWETTRQWLQHLRTERQLRWLGGWTSARQIPHEATFSRAFQEFAETELPQRLHAALILPTQTGPLSRSYRAGFQRPRSAPTPPGSAATTVASETQTGAPAQR